MCCRKQGRRDSVALGPGFSCTLGFGWVRHGQGVQWAQEHKWSVLYPECWCRSRGQRFSSGPRTFATPATLPFPLLESEPLQGRYMVRFRKGMIHSQGFILVPTFRQNPGYVSHSLTLHYTTVWPMWLIPAMATVWTSPGGLSPLYSQG